MNQQFGNETKEEVLVETHGEAEVGPVVTELETLKSIALEVNLTIEVLLVEDLHGNLALAAVGSTVMLAVEVKVVLDRTTSVLGLLVLTGRDGRSNSPEGHQNGNRGEDSKEDGSVETSANLAGQVPRNEHEQREEQGIGEAIAAGRVGGDGGIFDSRILRRGNKTRLASAYLGAQVSIGTTKLRSCSWNRVPRQLGTAQLAPTQDRHNKTNWTELTDVVRTPQGSAGVVQEAGGVSMNSNSSGDSG